jgi:hypothetical protein
MHPAPCACTGAHCEGEASHARNRATAAVFSLRLACNAQERTTPLHNPGTATLNATSPLALPTTVRGSARPTRRRPPSRARPVRSGRKHRNPPRRKGRALLSRPPAHVPRLPRRPHRTARRRPPKGAPRAREGFGRTQPRAPPAQPGPAAPPLPIARTGRRRPAGLEHEGRSGAVWSAGVTFGSQRVAERARCAAPLLLSQCSLCSLAEHILRDALAAGARCTLKRRPLVAAQQRS